MSDFQVVEELSEQFDVEVDHISADKMYDTDDVYDALTSKFPESELAIPPKENLYADDAHNPKRMRNLVAYFALGPMLTLIHKLVTSDRPSRRFEKS